MARYRSRAFSGAGDLRMLANLARTRTAERWPGATYWHAGDIAWQLYPALQVDHVGDVRLWWGGDALAAFAIFEAPINVNFDVHSAFEGDGELLDDVLGWAEARWRTHSARGSGRLPAAYEMLGAGSLAVVAFESDSWRRDALRQRGFEISGERHNVFFRRDLATEPEGGELPAGWGVRNVTEADVEERAELHRDAWSAWGTSGFTAERYRQLRALEEYDETLDVAVEEPGGRLVSYCLGWADDTNGVGTLEPVGCRPAFGGRGLTRVAILELLRRFRARGLRRALVSTASVNAPALALYRSCGFEVAEVERYLVKRMDGAV